MENVTIVHNPHCSKSREALKLIESHGHEPKIIDYLKGELTSELLENIVRLLKIHPREIIRTKEDEYKTLSIDINDGNEVIAAIVKHPKLLERPIVIKGDKAIIGRPPENILALF